MRTPGPDHASWADSVGAYLLGALPAGEREGFQAHLDACAVCRFDVDDLQVAADALLVSVPPVSPSPALKDRIMAVVESEAALLAAAGERADRVPARRRRFSLGGWLLRPAVAAACALVLLAVGGVAGALIAGGDETRTVAATVDAARAPDARVALEVRDGRGTLVAERMPPPPAGRIYQVWIKRPNQDPQPTSALWTVRDDGSAAVAVPGSLDDVEAVLVTDEPEGGADVPSRPPVISASPA
jgi:anti-sigma-K factor RskA